MIYSCILIKLIAGSLNIVCCTTYVMCLGYSCVFLQITMEIMSIRKYLLIIFTEIDSLTSLNLQNRPTALLKYSHHQFDPTRLRITERKFPKKKISRETIFGAEKS